MNGQEKVFSIEKVRKKSVPLLVVGLGGTGRDAVIAIKKTFSERYVLPTKEKGQDIPVPDKTAYLVLDSETRKPDDLELGEYVNISLPGIDRILKNAESLLSPFEKTWVDSRLSSISSGIFIPIRQAARLALSRNFYKVNAAVCGALQSVIFNISGKAEGGVDYVEVALVTGIGGGTGSGIFLDMCQIIRYAAKTVSAIPVRLTGYIVMPDVSLARVKHATGMELPIKRYAYAALKELDFWMRVKQHRVSYSMQYGDGTTIEWKDPPFERCILMSSSNAEGIPYKDGYSAVMSTIAESLAHRFIEGEGKERARYFFADYENYFTVFGTAYQTFPKKYPLFYGYRAIGAFTQRVPKKAILNYEGSLLLKTFMPRRDESGKPRPDRGMLTDMLRTLTAENIIGNGPRMMRDFVTDICRVPEFRNAGPAGPALFAGTMNAAPPHLKYRTWRDTVSRPAAAMAADKYLDKAWKRFGDWAAFVITDPARGPFALETFLEAPDGLVSDFTEALCRWTNQERKIRNLLVPRAEEACAGSWDCVLRPQILMQGDAMIQYIQDVNDLYTNVNKGQFLEKHCAALEMLILRVKEYLRDGLKPLCAALESLEKEFNTAETSDALLARDICDLSAEKDRIDAVFREANANGRLSGGFLRKIAEISLRTTPSADAKTSGVSFICGKEGSEGIREALKAGLEEYYGSLSNRPLDDIMIAGASEDVAEQRDRMDALARDAITNAQPMFMQDPALSQTPKDVSCQMWIPRAAPKYLRYLSTDFRMNDQRPDTESGRPDELHTLVSWTGLGLFRYGLFEELRTAYDESVGRGDCAGLHLVRGAESADYLSDWSRLPSPKPYFLFPGSGTYSERKEYEEVHELVERALKCGMITIKENVPCTEADIHILYMSDGTVMDSAALRKLADEIRNAKNPATGDACPESGIRVRLRQLLKGGRTETLKKAAYLPIRVEDLPGLDVPPADPRDPGVQAGATLPGTAKKKDYRLRVRMTEAMIYIRPDLVQALRIQLPAREAISEEIRRAEETVKLWEKRMSFAETAANMFLFLSGFIYQGGKDFKYKEKGNKYNIITPADLKDDVKAMQSPILCAACFLADAPDDNAAKADLTRLLAAAMWDYENALEYETVTRDEMEDLMTAADDALAELKDDIAAAESLMTANPGQKDALTPQTEMINEMIRTIETWKRVFRKIIRRID